MRDIQNYIDWDYFTLKNIRWWKEEFLCTETMANNATKLMKDMMKFPSKIADINLHQHMLEWNYKTSKAKRIFEKGTKRGNANYLNNNQLLE